MKIAIMGTRGIPANYGGFETFAEQLSVRLSQRGHEVTVYGRSNNIQYRGKMYKGVNLKILPTISHKYLDTVVHTFLSVIHGAFSRYDIVLVCNAANSIFTLIPRLVGQKVVINVDGIERKRDKWNWAGRAWYALGEVLAQWFPHVIVSDARVIREYFQEKYNKRSIMIPYGAVTGRVGTTQVQKQFGVQPNEYFLYVSRLEPENNAHRVIEAFRGVKTKKRLVLVGDAPYSHSYKERLLRLAGDDPRIVFTGFVYGEGYDEFRSHAYCYIQATEVGGTHPALIEAMAAGNCVVANASPENLEVVGEAGVTYRLNDVADLRQRLQMLVDNPTVITAYRERALQRIEAFYSWDRVVGTYELLFDCLVKGHDPLELSYM